MGEIKDFHCTYDNSAGINEEVTRKLNLQFPDAYMRWETMAAISKALKMHDGASFCELPFCHTVEAEAMGGVINYGNEKTGPRAKHMFVRLRKSCWTCRRWTSGKEGFMKCSLPARRLEGKANM